MYSTLCGLYMMLSLWWMKHVTFPCRVTSTTDPFTQQPHQPIYTILKLCSHRVKANVKAVYTELGVILWRHKCLQKSSKKNSSPVPSRYRFSFISLGMNTDVCGMNKSVRVTHKRRFRNRFINYSPHQQTVNTIFDL